MKFHATITGWGEDALGFLDMEEMNCVIIFNDNAPEELAEISILHTKSDVYEEPVPGDTLFFCGKAYDITAVGTEAKQTLRELGHCTLSFKGGNEPERPGCIMLEGEKLTPADIAKGGVIEIF